MRAVPNYEYSIRGIDYVATADREGWKVPLPTDPGSEGWTEDIIIDRICHAIVGGRAAGCYLSDGTEVFSLHALEDVPPCNPRVGETVTYKCEAGCGETREMSEEHHIVSQLSRARMAPLGLYMPTGHGYCPRCKADRSFVSGN